MKIHEYQAKELMHKAGIPIPEGEVASNPEQAQAIAFRIPSHVVIKAQVHVGGRGKAGGIKVAHSAKEAGTLTAQILEMKIKGLPVEKVLVEKVLAIQKEYYLGIVLDRDSQRNIIMFSLMGGMDIEEVAITHPEKIHKIGIDPLLGLTDPGIRTLLYSSNLPRNQISDISRIIRQLYQVYVKYDATLAEINPLVVTHDGTIMAADGKINIDDNALYRQATLTEWKESSEEDPIEAVAHQKGLQYVRLQGDIGIIGNGAGLVMATLDEVKRAGGNPANFLDIGGGATAEHVKAALETVLMDPNIKGILFNVFGGITRCDEVAKGILLAIGQVRVQIPIVVRLTGTRAEEGRALLQSGRLLSADSMQDAAQLILEAAYGHSA